MLGFNLYSPLEISPERDVQTLPSCSPSASHICTNLSVSPSLQCVQHLGVKCHRGAREVLLRDRKVHLLFHACFIIKENKTQTPALFLSSSFRLCSVCSASPQQPYSLCTVLFLESVLLLRTLPSRSAPSATCSPFWLTLLFDTQHRDPS